MRKRTASRDSRAGSLVLGGRQRGYDVIIVRHRERAFEGDEQENQTQRIPGVSGLSKLGKFMRLIPRWSWQRVALMRTRTRH
jgi:hypothetical protein